VASETNGVTAACFRVRILVLPVLHLQRSGIGRPSRATSSSKPSEHTDVEFLETTLVFSGARRG
jgi:hypothetical protein